MTLTSFCFQWSRPQRCQRRTDHPRSCWLQLRTANLPPAVLRVTHQLPSTVPDIPQHLQLPLDVTVLLQQLRPALPKEVHLRHRPCSNHVLLPHSQQDRVQRRQRGAGREVLWDPGRAQQQQHLRLQQVQQGVLWPGQERGQD